MYILYLPGTQHLCGHKLFWALEKKKKERFVVGKTVLLKLGINELTTYEFWAAFSIRNSQTRQISNRAVHADNRASAAPTFFKDDKTE